MKRPILAMLILGFCAAFAAADHVIQIRLSIKVITNPDTGADPAGLAGVDLAATVDGMNVLMEQFGRGYEFVIVDPILRVGGAGQHARPSPSFYSNQGLLTGSITRADLHADALANPAMYAWNPSAINIFINDVSNRMLCDPPNNVIVLGDGAAHDSGILLHDIGHFFGLCNTQGCGCECCVNPGPCPSNAPGVASAASTPAPAPPTPPATTASATRSPTRPAGAVRISVRSTSVYRPATGPRPNPGPSAKP